MFKSSRTRFSTIPVIWLMLPPFRNYSKVSVIAWSDRFPQIHPSCPILNVKPLKINRRERNSRDLSWTPCPKAAHRSRGPFAHLKICMGWVRVLHRSPSHISSPSRLRQCLRHVAHLWQLRPSLVTEGRDTEIYIYRFNHFCVCEEQHTPPFEHLLTFNHCFCSGNV